VIRTRGAAAGDAPAVTGVVAAAFTRYVERLGGIRPWPMTLDYAEIIADGQTWVAEEVAGDVAGHVAAGDGVGVLVLEDRADHLLLDVLAVAPSHQGSGVGRRLMTLAEQEARERGFDEVRLFTNRLMSENLAYYPRQGYAETHRDQIAGFHRVHFAKRL